MDMSAYVEEVKLKLTGEVVDLELEDSTLVKVINSAFREIQRYIATTKLITIPYSSCIDLTEYKVSSVTQVYRVKGYLNDGENQGDIVDPMYLAAWQLMSGNGQYYNTSDWTYNYASWNTALQIRNTTSTDLIFRFEKHTNKLYINTAFDTPKFITIEYVPRYDDVSEITSDYWIDVLIELSVALTKVTLGRVRSKYKQSNALWTLDGDTLLSEGNEELKDIRERLRKNNQLLYGID